MTWRELFLPFKKVLRKPRNPQLPRQCITLGDHIRTARIERGLLQREVAVLLDVCEDSVTHWENNVSQPQLRHYPLVLQFLGYYPFQHAIDTISGKITQIRFCNGYSYARLGRQLLVDASTVRAWELETFKVSTEKKLMIEALWTQLPLLKQQDHP